MNTELIQMLQNECGLDTPQEAHIAAANLIGFMETLIEIDNSLKNKGNSNENIRSANILH